MSDANTRQVGGTHYQSPYQHWDLVVKIGLDYLGAQVIKYLTRYRKKNGLQDVEKAGHFLDKLIECSHTVIIHRPAYPIDFIRIEVQRFILWNNLEERVRPIVHIICTWQNADQLALAKTLLNELIKALQEEIERRKADIERRQQELNTLNPDEAVAEDALSSEDPSDFEDDDDDDDMSPETKH